ncbi:MAG: KpsF/GutQ family sugar-phosphate isomerase [Luminiphilus sp.]|nr:KpsF/GutQ family sugar-phosphate isomerase [Luminiphilus sp.]
MRHRIDQQFAGAIDLLLSIEGRVVVTGMGKSGHIGKKIAATLASTGTPALFVHPGEACHGDMGMITKSDGVILLSNSGSTSEITALLPLLKRQGVPLIAMTGKPDSVLAKAANVHLDVGVEEEACPLDLAPTASTTAALVMGDAIAIALLERRGFTAEDFALSHPGGALGRKLLTRVSDLMVLGTDIPSVIPETTLPDALMEISAKGLGMTTVIDNTGQLLGIFTDGDLRRALEEHGDITAVQVKDVMSQSAKTIDANALAVEAVTIMEREGISALVIAGDDNEVDGVIQLLALLRAGVA